MSWRSGPGGRPLPKHFPISLTCVADIGRRDGTEGDHIYRLDLDLPVADPVTTSNLDLGATPEAEQTVMSPANTLSRSAGLTPRTEITPPDSRRFDATGCPPSVTTTAAAPSTGSKGWRGTARSDAFERRQRRRRSFPGIEVDGSVAT